MSSRAVLAAIAVLWLVSACAWEVIDLSEPTPALSTGGERLDFTVAVVPGSFDASRLLADGVTEHFARELRDAELFQAVMHPVPQGARPIWQIELAARDEAREPDQNFWKSFAASALPPVALFVHFENDFSLELRALLLRNRELVATYVGRGSIRHRYQTYADRQGMEAQALDRLARRATAEIIAGVVADAGRLRAEDRARAGQR